MEQEEELREKAGEYDSEEESEDEEMQEIRHLASQIREKRKLKIIASKEKDTNGPRLPRTAKKVCLCLSILFLKESIVASSFRTLAPKEDQS